MGAIRVCSHSQPKSTLTTNQNMFFNISIQNTKRDYVKLGSFVHTMRAKMNKNHLVERTLVAISRRKTTSHILSQWKRYEARCANRLQYWPKVTIMLPLVSVLNWIFIISFRNGWLFSHFRTEAFVVFELILNQF